MAIQFIKRFLDAVPSSLKSANEIYNFARQKYKQEMGVFPEGIDDIGLKRGAAEIQEQRNKVVKFDELTPDPRIKQPKNTRADVMRAHENISGGSGYAEGDTKFNADVLGEEIARMRGLIDEGQDATDMNPEAYSKIYDEAYSYLTQLRMLNRKPKSGGVMSTIEGQTKMRSPEEIMDFLMKSGKSQDTNIGKAPKTTKTKPKVDPKLQAMEDQKQLFLDFGDRIESDAEKIARMKRENKEAVARLKKKKEKDLGDKLKDLPDDIPDMAGGGLAYMLGEPRQPKSAGGQIFKFLKALSEKSPYQRYKDYLASVKRRAQTEPGKLAPELGAITAGGIFTNRRMKDILEEGNEQQKEEFLKEFIADLDKNPFYKKYPDLKDKAIEKYTQTLFGEKRADGGRIGFADGGMSRRTFLKIMAALASFPVAGKLFKTAKVAKKTAPIVTPTSDMPAHFPKLVEKIIREGQVVDSEFVKKTGNVKTYKHPDKPDLELQIEGDGDVIRLEFETDQGMKGGYEFRKGAIVDEPTSPMRGQRGPNEFYEGEVKYRGDTDGNYVKDFEEGIETGTENLDEFAGVGKQKSSKSKVNLDAYDDLGVEDELSEGGLAGLLGETKKK